MAKRKIITMLVTITAPTDCTPAQARKEVRENIAGQRMHTLDEGDIKVRSVRSAKART